MSKEHEFLEKLSLLKEKALGQDSRISQEEVQDFFAQDALNEEQMLMVYDYLLSQRITVTGYMKSQDILQEEGPAVAPYTSDEEAYLKEYKEDLSALRVEKEGERKALFAAIVAGDGEARGRLTELYLPVVLDIAVQMRHPEVFLGDLVQEGNVSLMLALEFLKAERLVAETEEELEALDLRLKREIRQGIQVMIEEQTEMKRCDKKMEQQVNDLNDALHQLAEDKGRAVTLEELAEYMELTEEAILDIMKLAGEDLYEKYKDSATK